jgi:hypothetical protein
MSQFGGDATSGGRLELLAADGGVDEHFYVLRPNLGHRQRLAGGLHSAARGGITRLPPATLDDAGQRLQLPFRQVQGLVKRAQPGLQLLSGHDLGRQLVADGVDKNTRVLHGNSSSRKVKSFI